MTKMKNLQLEPETAYADLDEEKYRAEFDLLDRFHSFSSEILRLSLLGITVFGFLYKEVFADISTSSKFSSVPIALVKGLSAWSVLLFAASVIFALIYRYVSIESMRLFIDGLRLKVYNESSEQIASKLSARHNVRVFSATCKVLSVLCIGVGASFLAFSFFTLMMN